MKNFVLLLGLLFAFQFVLKAQVMDTDDVVFNVHLLETFDIEVTAGGTQEITFATPVDYNLGVTEGAGIVDGVSTVTVNATGNWDMTMEAPDFLPGGGPNPGTNSIPINNLGFWIVSTGVYNFGDELTLPLGNDLPENSAAMPITGSDVVVIGNGPGGNTGGEAENTFVFHWEMGTMRTNPAAPMNLNTMFSQLAAGDFSLGDYTTTAILTLRKIP